MNELEESLQVKNAQDNLYCTALSAQLELYALFERVGIEVEGICREYGKENAILAWEKMIPAVKKGISSQVALFVRIRIKRFSQDKGGDL